MIPIVLKTTIADFNRFDDWNLVEIFLITLAVDLYIFYLVRRT